MQVVKLLIVDDDENDVLIYRRYLKNIKDCDFVITAVSSIQEALKKTEVETFDCVLCDYYLPDGEGQFLVQKMRVGTLTKGACIIVCSGQGDEQIAVKCIKSGADDYLSKNVITKTALQRTLVNALEKRQLRNSVEIQKKEIIKGAKFKADFLAKISHELRTPLNSIIGNIEMLHETPLDSEQIDYVTTLSRTSKFLLNIINDLLDLSKIEAGQFQFEKRKLDLEDVLSDPIKVMEVPIKQRGLKFVLDVEDIKGLHVIGDAKRIQQILINLLSNASKFTSQGEVGISAKVIEKSNVKAKVRFRIWDTGIGIAEEKFKRIFKMYQQADSKIDHQFGGTGLGLNISKFLVQRLKGKIWLNSEEGVGTEFFVELVFNLCEEEARPTKLEVFNNTELKEKKKLLIVDDAPDNLMLIKAYLKKSPYEIICATNGQEAFDIFTQTNDIDLVLMDVQMPIMNGHEATRKIREWEKENNRERKPVIALTAYALKEEVEKSIEAGASLHLTKPVTKKALIETLWSYLEKGAA